jgi:catechol 2,3-dioxygenase-like lactoylglutathione lyase family enzyme
MDATGFLRCDALSPMDLDHLNLRVRDAVACRDFYVEHYGFRPSFETDEGYFIRNDDGFTLALFAAEEHQVLPDGFHIGFGARDADEVVARHRALTAAGVRCGDVEDFRPDERYVTFRCWDPDGTEIENYWEVV